MPPTLYLARHGETAWSLSGQHTGRTDIPLTARGRDDGVRLGTRFKGMTFAAVLTSPLQRARVTAELAGFATATVDADLREWDYGEYEGKKSVEIHRDRPDWQLFRDGCPGGENADAVGARADRVLARLGAMDGNALVFSHGHFLRVLGARWLGLPAAGGRLFYLGTATLSILGHEHHRADQPVVQLWNDNRHLVD